MVEELLRYRFTAEPSQLKIMRERLKQVLETQRLPSKVPADWVLAVNEACMNIIQHAYGQQPGNIELTVMREGGRFSFEIQDQAPAVDVVKIQPRELDDIRPGGLGLHLMQSIMDEVIFMPNNGGTGNRLLMQVELQEMSAL